jgi:hypothetical protein
MAGDEFTESVEALAQKMRILAAVLHHPLDEGVPALSRGRGAPVISAGHVGQSWAGSERRRLHGRAENELASIHWKLTFVGSSVRKGAKWSSEK